MSMLHNQQFAPFGKPITITSSIMRLHLFALTVFTVASAEQIVSQLSGKCMHVMVGGNRIVHSECKQDDHFEFEIVDKNDGSFQLVASRSGLCIGVEEGSFDAEAFLVQEECQDDSESQLWHVQGDGEQKQIVAKHTDMCITIPFKDTSDGVALVQFPCAITKADYWQISREPDTMPPPPPPSLFASPGNTSNLRVSLPIAYKRPTPAPVAQPISAFTWLKSNLSNKCVEVPDASQDDNVPLEQFHCLNGEENFEVGVEPVIADEWFRLRFRHSNKCVGVMNGSQETGAMIVQEPCLDDRDSQLWSKFGDGSGDSVQLVVRHTDECFTLMDGSTDNSVGVQMNPCADDSGSDLWVFEDIVRSKWEGPYPLSTVAVAVANLPDGRLLAWSAYSRMNFVDGGGRQTWVAFFDPETNETSEALLKSIRHDMFCPGTALLEDGRIAITGGNNSPALTLYDPSTDTWERKEDMNIRRGYHSMTLLGDGTVFTLGGSWSGSRGGKDGEVWDPEADVWEEKPNIQSDGSVVTDDSRGIYRSDNHMWLFTAPNGKIFHAGPAKRTHWMTTDGGGSVTRSVLRNNADQMNGNAVMFDIGKILTLGGAPDYEKTDSTARAHVIDINDEEAVTVERVGDMETPRALHNSVVLPSGEVVVTGGQTRARLFRDTDAVYTAEIFNPTTKKFTTLSSMQVPRTYHGVAILMKDARVWVAGGGLCGSCKTNHLDAEILTPPYLLTKKGEDAVRPVIQYASETTSAGGVIVVSMDTAKKHTFALVRHSAVTHTINNDGRRFPLSIVSKSSNTFYLRIPENPNVALAGPYFLFAMNKDGVPSIAENLRIELRK